MRITITYDPTTNPDWQPADGDFFSAVVAALDHFEIPCRIDANDEPDPFDAEPKLSDDEA